MNKKETSLCIPLKAQKGHSELEVIEGTEVHRVQRQQRKERGVAAALQQQQINIKPPQH